MAPARANCRGAFDVLGEGTRRVGIAASAHNRCRRSSRSLGSSDRCYRDECRHRHERRRSPRHIAPWRAGPSPCRIWCGPRKGSAGATPDLPESEPRMPGGDCEGTALSGRPSLERRQRTAGGRRRRRRASTRAVEAGCSRRIGAELLGRQHAKPIGEILLRAVSSFWVNSSIRCLRASPHRRSRALRLSTRLRTWSSRSVMRWVSWLIWAS